jgi:PIN domain nuclease of toxin-antitoxin system
VRVLLDTSAFIFSVQAPDRLSRRAYSVLNDPENIRELSVVSLMEIAVKAALGKLNLSAANARQAIDDLDLRVLPVSAEHAFHLFGVPNHHRDPFDRQIIAQALFEGIPVVTSDRNFALYRGLKVIW